MSDYLLEIDYSGFCDRGKNVENSLYPIELYESTDAWWNGIPLQIVYKARNIFAVADEMETNEFYILDNLNC